MAWKKTHKTASQVASEIQSDITDKFIACLEQGEIPWRKPWNATENGFLKSDGKSYSFMNALLIAIMGGTQGEYVTLNEIANRTKTSIKDGTVWDCFNKIDGKVPKSYTVYFYSMVEYTRKDRETGKPLTDDDGNEIKGRYPILKASHVWQAGVQVNCPLKFEKKGEKKIVNPNAECDAMVVDYSAREGIKITHNPSEAFYSPSGDYISIPEINQFVGTEEYYSTLFHEMAHSTGHEKRLKRELAGRMNRDSYSFEELIAEISACAMLHDKGIATEATDKNSMAYVQNWAKVLKSDPTMVEKACRSASKAVNFIYHGK